MTGITIDRLDHLVLTVVDIDATCDFYARVLGMERVTFAGGRTALAFGCQKINLHVLRKTFSFLVLNMCRSGANMVPKGVK